LYSWISCLTLSLLVTKNISIAWVFAIIHQILRIWILVKYVINLHINKPSPIKLNLYLEQFLALHFLVKNFLKSVSEQHCIFSWMFHPWSSLDYQQCETVVVTILSRDRVTIHGVWIGNQIYWTLVEVEVEVEVEVFNVQLGTIFYKSLSHTDQRSIIPAY
jgi:hypothetical protein